MQKIILIICIGLIGLQSNIAFSQSKQQQKPGQAKPATPPPPRVPPPQYVQKKDFEAKMGELEDKVRSAVNAGASARSTARIVSDSMNSIGMRIEQIESVLSSANFQIALNSDSLKTTQGKIDELKTALNMNIAQLQSKNEEQSMMINILMALCVVLPLVVAVMMFMMFKKAHASIRNSSERISTDVQKNYMALQEEIKNFKTGIQGEVYNAKADMNHKLTGTKEDLQKQILALAERMDPLAEEGAEEAPEQ